MRERNYNIILLILAAVCFSAVSAVAQSTTFTDPNAEYTFEVPDQKWKMITKPSPTNPNVEFVFVDRQDGHFEVRKIAKGRNVPMGDIIREEEARLQFMRGFVAGREENFSGRLSGTIYNFEFVARGRPMSGRFYFLRSGDAVYVLRFTGLQDSLRSLRIQTDLIARTFNINTAE